MKSIFFKEVYEKEYELTQTYSINTKEVTYTILSQSNGLLPYSKTLIRRDIVMECDLSEPMLQINQKILNKKDNTELIIFKAIRTSDDIVEYLVGYKSEDTEDSIKRRNCLEYDILQYDNQQLEIKELKLEIEYLKKQQVDIIIQEPKVSTINKPSIFSRFFK